MADSISSLGGDHREGDGRHPGPGDTETSEEGSAAGQPTGTDQAAANRENDPPA